MTYKTYEFTAFSEAGLQDSGALSGNLGCGSTFTMPQYADVCISVTDNDPYLSGDSCHNENADDHYGQHASIEGADGELGNGGQIYAEQYFWVQDQYGNYFLLIEIEQEGGSGDYFTFHQAYGMPSAGAELTVKSACNVTSNWIDYKCLDGGDKPPATGTISGTVWCDVDCDGLQDACVLETKGENLIKNGDFEHNPLYSHQGWGTFSSIEGWYAGSGHIEIMEGHHWGIHNEYGNAVLELDANYNSTVCQQVHVETAGTYCLTLDYQMRGHDTSTNGFEVYVNGVLVETVHPTQEGVFEELELSFDLPAGTARIDLKAPLKQTLARHHVRDLRCADPERQRAERAMRARVAVTTHNRHAGMRRTQFRPDHVHDATCITLQIQQVDAEGLAVPAKCLDLRARSPIQDRQTTWPVTGQCRHRMVNRRQRPVRTPQRQPTPAQHLERLRRRHLVNEMQVDVQHGRRRIRLRCHHMRIPDLVEKRLPHQPAAPVFV